MPRYYPICLRLVGADCLVVGGGKVALRKARSLIEAEADVRVVSREFCPELATLDGVHLIQHPFEEADVEGAALVYAATDDPELNSRVARAARAAGALVNVVDTPAECDFIVPSTLVRDRLTVSISSGGAAPALSRRLRLELEEQFPKSLGNFVGLLAELRCTILERVPEAPRRGTIFRTLAERTTWDLFEREGPDAVRRLAHRLVGQGAGTD